jgi:hypothetical protein
VQVTPASAGCFSLVHAGGKGAPRACDDDGADFRIGFNFVKRGV